MMDSSESPMSRHLQYVSSTSLGLRLYSHRPPPAPKVRSATSPWKPLSLHSSIERQARSLLPNAPDCQRRKFSGLVSTGGQAVKADPS